MADFIDAGKIGDLQNGGMKMVKVKDQEVLLVKIAGKFYATQNRCTHMGGDLSQGKLEGTIVTCPRHHSQYNVTDGHLVRWTDWTGLKLSLAKIARSPRSLKTYEVRVDGDRVLVSATESAHSQAGR